MEYTKQDCIEALHKADGEVEGGLSAQDYRELDYDVTIGMIKHKFGSWNEAKKNANISLNSKGTKSEKPDVLGISTEEWESFTPNKRTRIKKRLKLYRLKVNVGCEACGYDESHRALQFHHLDKDEKEFNISRYGIDFYSWEKAKSEIKKCQVLCSNCHSIKESTDLKLFS